MFENEYILACISNNWFFQGIGNIIKTKLEISNISSKIVSKNKRYLRFYQDITMVFMKTKLPKKYL